MKKTVTFSNTLTMSLPETESRRDNTDFKLVPNAFQSSMSGLTVDGDDLPVQKRSFAEMSSMISMISTRMSTEEFPVNRKCTLDTSFHINQISIQEINLEDDLVVSGGGGGGDVDLKEEGFDDDANSDDMNEDDNYCICTSICRQCHDFFSHIGDCFRQPVSKM